MGQKGTMGAGGGRVNRRLILLLAVLVGLLAAATWSWRPLASGYQLRRGRLALEQREPRAALQFFHAARQIDPQAAEVHFQMARAYRRLGQLDRMHESLKNAWRLGHDLHLLEREQWLVLAQTGQLADTEQPLLRLLSSPSEMRAWEVSEALVQGYFIQLRFIEAAQVLDAWQDDYPTDPEPHFLRGYYHEALYRYFEAVAEYERGLQKAPRRTDARLRLAGVLHQQRDFERAERELLRCRDEQPGDLQVQAAWATHLFLVGRNDEARAAFEQVLTRAPDHEDALRRMGQIELADNRPADALRWLRPAAEKNPQDTTVRYALAQALQADGREDQAEPHFQYVAQAEQAIRQLDFWLPEVLERPHDVELRYQIGTTIMQYISPSDGARWLNTVLEREPGHQAAHRKLAAYHATRGNRRAAHQHRQQAGQAPSPNH